jgi:hypothetical protein
MKQCRHPIVFTVLTDPDRWTLRANKSYPTISSVPRPWRVTHSCRTTSFSNGRRFGPWYTLYTGLLLLVTDGDFWPLVHPAYRTTSLNNGELAHESVHGRYSTSDIKFVQPQKFLVLFSNKDLDFCFAVTQPWCVSWPIWSLLPELSRTDKREQYNLNIWPEDIPRFRKWVHQARKIFRSDLISPAHNSTGQNGWRPTCHLCCLPSRTNDHNVSGIPLKSPQL